MASIVAYEYRLACANYLKAALRYPRMYYASLPMLEAQMSGHATAFSQLGVLEKRESFNADFAAWLRAETDVSAAAGWVYAIGELAQAADTDPEELFVRCVREFLSVWVPAA